MEKKDVFIAVLQPEDESARQRAELLRKYVMPHKNLIYSICIKYTYNQDEPSGNSMGMDNYREFYNDDILWALDRLKPIYREALLLQQAGYKLGEIMEITYNNGTLQTRNVETVKSRIFLAKTQLRKLLTRDGEKRMD